MVHVILDNYATHQHRKVREWLTRHPRFVFHFAAVVIAVLFARVFGVLVYSGYGKMVLPVATTAPN
jgi:hypothetical protein